MNASLWLQFIRGQFPSGKTVEFSYPALEVGGRTLIFGRVSEMEDTRAEVNRSPHLLRPVVPVLAGDCKVPEGLPKFLWVLSNEFGLFLLQGSDQKSVLHRYDLPGYVPSSCPEPIPDKECVECQYSINPCSIHIWDASTPH